MHSVQGRGKCERSGVFLGPDTKESRQQSFDPCPLLISVLAVIAQILDAASHLERVDVEMLPVGTHQCRCQLKMPFYKH